MKTREQYLKYLERLGTETVYLYNDLEDIAVKVVGGVGYFVRVDGEDQKIDVDSDMALQAVVGEHEITKEQYENKKAL